MLFTDKVHRYESFINYCQFFPLTVCTWGGNMPSETLISMSEMSEWWRIMIQGIVIQNICGTCVWEGANVQRLAWNCTLKRNRLSELQMYHHKERAISPRQNNSINRFNAVPAVTYLGSREHRGYFWREWGAWDPPCRGSVVLSTFNFWDGTWPAHWADPSQECREVCSRNPCIENVKLDKLASHD